MIVTDLEHATEQIAMTPYLRKAIDFLRHARWQGLPKGRFEIDGDKVWGLVQSYETVTALPARLEAHCKHIDVHFLVSGEEIIGWIPAEHLTPDEPYDQARDVWWGTLSVSLDQVTRVRLRARQVAVLFPSDGHLPRRASGVPARVKKVLIKVAAQA